MTMTAAAAVTAHPSLSIQSLDLAAQQTMAYWTQAMFWATVGSIAVSIAALVGLFWSLVQTRRAVRDTRQIGEYQTQAYVHASKAKWGLNGRVILTCKNTGQTPATHFNVRANAQRIKTGSVTESIRCDRGTWKTWTSLGSQEELTVILDLQDVDVVDDFRQRQFEKNEVLLISGQIVYCTIFNHDYETQFAFYIDHAAPDRFRRPTANLRSFWRAPGSIAPTEHRT